MPLILGQPFCSTRRRIGAAPFDIIQGSISSMWRMCARLVLGGNAAMAWFHNGAVHALRLTPDTDEPSNPKTRARAASAQALRQHAGKSNCRGSVAGRR
jgi:hypothetical protein